MSVTYDPGHGLRIDVAVTRAIKIAQAANDTVGMLWNGHKIYIAPTHEQQAMATYVAVLGEKS